MSLGLEQTPPWRSELKVPLDEFQYQSFIDWLSETGLKLQRCFPDRLVQSVYLDSENLDDYHDNVAGISRRGKVRFRWYDQQPATMVLEMKNKEGRHSNKYVIPLPNERKLVPDDRSTMRELLSSEQKAGGVIRQQLLFPTLGVSYKRSYFELAPGLRMTMDRNIRYRGLFPHRSSSQSASPVARVVEFKFPVERRREVASMLSGMPARIFRHSKYVVGLDTVCAG